MPLYPADFTVTITPWIPQPPLYPADLTTPLYPADLTTPLYPADLIAAILPSRSHSRHSTRPISQPPFYSADLTAAILLGRSHNRHSIRPTFHLLWIFHTRRLPPDGRGGRFNFQLSLQIKMSFKLKHLTVEHSCSELVPSIQNFPASLHGNLAIHTFSFVCFFDWELIVLN